MKQKRFSRKVQSEDVIPACLDMLIKARARGSKRLDVGDLAGAIGCSNDCLERHFRTLNTSPGRWISGQRFAFACCLLDCERTLPISEISRLAGYNHASNLANDFKRILPEHLRHLTPIRYRRMMGA
jgi:transcriptional regulator GlxA family with amidase domain